jgi:mannose-6-phosphate isomerase
VAGPVLLVSGPVGVGKTTVSRLVAEALAPAFHLPIDAFARFAVGRDPWDPALHHVVGAAAVTAAWEYAHGGFAVVVDGHLFPDAVDRVVAAGEAQGITVVPVWLRADLATCLARVEQRDGRIEDGVPALHARYADLGPHEAHVVDATAPPEEIAAAILRDGRLRVHHDGGMEQDTRPWGGYLVLEDAEAHKVKRITVTPGQRLSYQTHARRAEHWFVVAGSGVVTLDGEPVPVGRGVAVDIPLGSAHRIENTGDADLVFIEVQHGDYFGEDDIVRLEDDYGR